MSGIPVEYNRVKGQNLLIDNYAEICTLAECYRCGACADICSIEYIEMCRRFNRKFPVSIFEGGEMYSL